MRSKTNENRKGYKNTPLGWIPEDWEVKKISNITKTTAGGTPNTKKPEYWGGNIKWMNSGELNLKKIYDVEGRITDEGLKYSSTKIIPAYCVLIGLAGQGKTRGTVAMNMIPLCTNQSIAAVFPSEKFYEGYLYYNLDSRYYELRKLSTGDGGRGGLNLGLINSLLIPLPPFQEQKKLADIFRTWNNAIEKTQLLIELNEKRKKALMQKLLSGKKRLRGFKGEWQKLPAEEIFKYYSKKGFKNEILLSVTQDKGVIPRNLLEARVTMPSGELDSFKLVDEGDFVISLRSFQGGLEYSKYRGVVSPAYTVLKSFKKIDNDFYRYYFKSSDFIGHLSIAVIGIRDGKQISYGDFCIVKIPYPSFDEQKAIASILKAADKEIDLLKQKLEALKHQKKGLMQVLLTGKIRIINYEKNK